MKARIIFERSENLLGDGRYLKGDTGIVDGYPGNGKAIVIIDSRNSKYFGKFLEVPIDDIKFLYWESDGKA